MSSSHPSCARLSLSCGAAVLALVGCSSVQLVPLQPARGSEALVVGSGIEVSADSRRHPPSLPSNFTPVRLTVHNTGNTPLYINLEDIELAGPEHALDAVPPGSVPVHPRIASLGMDPASPFLVQQTIGGSGPRAGRTESVILEPRPGSLPDWAATRDSGRREIWRSAFRSGPIAAGETREGFVYFRAVPKGAERVTLRVGVRSGPHGAQAALVEIPYAVRG
ncbi:MAG TPA: hypothetical protein VG963_27140 [Polyangiaceae bacterium]|nr:hypothetical protein [Polyangiaceae bacterium]